MAVPFPTDDGAFFRGQSVAVAGNNDEAVEEVLFLTRLAHRVHLLVPPPELKASPDLAAEVSQHSRVEIHMATRLREVIGEQQVEGVRVVPRGGEEQMMPMAGVFIYLQGGNQSPTFWTATSRRRPPRAGLSPPSEMGT
ncbi:MAG: NAD(P)/FAD-dependent oxidoreductase [Anaerolineae bacterium]